MIAARAIPAWFVRRRARSRVTGLRLGSRSGRARGASCARIDGHQPRPSRKRIRDEKRSKSGGATSKPVALVRALGVVQVEEVPGVGAIPALVEFVLASAVRAPATGLVAAHDRSLLEVSCRAVVWLASSWAAVGDGVGRMRRWRPQAARRSAARSRALRARGLRGDLLVAREARRRADGSQARRPAADADRDLRRADAAAPLGGDEALDDAVLERVVGEDGQPAARPQQVDGRGQRRGQRLQLAVDRDAQGLEGARRGMRPPTAAAGDRHDALDERGQVGGGLDRPRPALLDDRARDAPSVGLLAVGPQDVRDLGLVELAQQRRPPGAPLAGVEAQVERAVGERKLKPRSSSASWKELSPRSKRMPSTGSKPVAAATSAMCSKFACRSVTRPPKPRQALAAPGDGRLIGIQSEQAAIRRIRLQDPDGVPSAAERGVDLELARERRESQEDLLHHHGPVPLLRSCHADVGSVRILKTRVVR